MSDDRMIPLCSNHFSVSTNNGQTFIFQFRFQEPPLEAGKPGEIKLFARIAIDRIGAERFLTLLQATLNKTKGKGGGGPAIPPNASRL